MRNKLFITTCFLAGLLALSGCHDKPVQQTSAQDTKISRPGVNGASPGKPLPPIRIDYHVAKDIQPGIPFIISLSVTPMVDAQQVQLHYRTPAGLESGDPQTNFSFGPTPAGTTLHQDITVIAPSEGRFRVILSVVIASQRGHAGSHSMSIPFVVGNPPPLTLKPEGKIDKDAQGQAIEVTPAQEEVIKH